MNKWIIVNPSINQWIQIYSIYSFTIPNDLLITDYFGPIKAIVQLIYLSLQEIQYNKDTLRHFTILAPRLSISTKSMITCCHRLTWEKEYLSSYSVFMFALPQIQAKTFSSYFICCNIFMICFNQATFRFSSINLV